MGIQQITERFDRSLTSSFRCCIAFTLCAAFAVSAASADLQNNFEGGNNYVIANQDNYDLGHSDLWLGWTSSNNTLTISNSTVTVGGWLYFGQTTENNNNHLIINEGSKVSINAINRNLYGLSTDSSILITGKGTSLTMTGSRPGGGQRYTGAAITIADNGLMKMPFGGFHQPSTSYSTNTTPIHLDGGFYAAKTTNQLANHGGYTWDMTLFRYWDGATQSWLAANGYDDFFDHFAVSYILSGDESDELLQTLLGRGYNLIDEQAFFDATGHSDMGGYSIVSAIPEPATYAAIFGLIIGGMALLHRRRK